MRALCPKGHNIITVVFLENNVAASVLINGDYLETKINEYCDKCSRITSVIVKEIIDVQEVREDIKLLS